MQEELGGAGWAPRQEGLQQEGQTRLKVPVRGLKHSGSHVGVGGTPTEGAATQLHLSCPNGGAGWRGCWAGGSAVSSFGGLLSAFTKCRWNGLLGGRGSLPTLAWGHGRQSESLREEQVG